MPRCMKPEHSDRYADGYITVRAMRIYLCPACHAEYCMSGGPTRRIGATLMLVWTEVNNGAAKR